MKGRKTRILITGASGFLGSHLVKGLAKDTTVSGTFLKHREGIPPCGSFLMDLTDPSSIRQALKERKFDVIIHTAAVTNPDQCEKNRRTAYQTNVQGTETLAEAARKEGALFIYISTDLVFDGKGRDYSESDPPRPCNYYAETKLKGEEVVQNLCGKWMVLRTALMYGWGNGFSSSFVDWLSQKLEAGEAGNLFLDQFRTFLYVGDAAPAIRTLLKRGVKNQVIHLGGPDRLSRFEFGKRFVDVFGYSRDLVRPIRMEDLEGVAPRGRDCSLNTERIKGLGFQPLTVMAGLEAMKVNLLQKHQ
jgi:dTDP-4-dehydrorhamnose reductase